MNLKGKPVLCNEIWPKLAEIIVFPPNVKSATIRLVAGEAVEVDCTYHAPVEIDVTKLDSKARELAQSSTLVHRRFLLVPID